MVAKQQGNILGRMFCELFILVDDMSDDTDKFYVASHILLTHGLMLWWEFWDLRSTNLNLSIVT